MDEDWEFDRMALRTEFDSKISPSKTYCTFMLGRLLNEMRYHYSCQMVLGVAPVEPRLSTITVDILELIRQLELTIEQQTKTLLEFSQCKKKINSFLNGEASLANWASTREAFDGEYDEEIDLFEILNSFVAGIDSQIQAFLESQKSSLREMDFAAMRIGYHLDKVLHPTWAQQTHMLGERPVRSRLFETTDTSSDQPFVPPHQVKAIWLDESWLRQLVHLENAFRRTSSSDFAKSNILKKELTSSCDFLDEYENLVRDNRNGKLVTSDLTSTGKRRQNSFGMEIQFDQRSVSRSNVEVTLSAQHFKLFVALMNSRSPLRTQFLADNWSVFSTDIESASCKHVRAAISRLGGFLTTVDIMITSVPNIGYELRPSASSDAS